MHELLPMWFSHHMQGYAAAGKAGIAGVVACTREPSSIYSCSHVQHAQETGDLPLLSPLVSKPPSSTEVAHLFPRKRQRSATPLSYTTTCTSGSPRRKESLGFKALLQTGRQANLVLAHPRDALVTGLADRTGETHASQTPKDASPPSYTQRG